MATLPKFISANPATNLAHKTRLLKFRDTTKDKVCKELFLSNHGRLVVDGFILKCPKCGINIANSSSLRCCDGIQVYTAACRVDTTQITVTNFRDLEPRKMPLTHGNYNYASACDMSQTDKSISGYSSFTSKTKQTEQGPRSKFINDKFKLNIYQQ